MSSDEAGQAVADSEETEPRMGLKVEIKEIGTCRKHISVTVPEADIRTIREDALGELSTKAEVPGFRVGKVPIALLEKRFKKEISADIKQKVLMASLEQLSDNRFCINYFWKRSARPLRFDSTDGQPKLPILDPFRPGKALFGPSPLS